MLFRTIRGKDIVDEAGNAIKVPQGNWLTGTKDGKWIQVKDGGGHTREKDVRGREPHSYIPGVLNPDGTPWLPIQK